MSKRQIIKELALEVETARRDYAEVVRQRDVALRAQRAYEAQATVRAAAKAEAAIQEKVDGIRAGLIPTSELRKAFDELVIDGIGDAYVTYHFPKGGDRIQKAISDALTAKPKAEGGYTGLRGDLWAPVTPGEQFFTAQSIQLSPFDRQLLRDLNSSKVSS